MKVFQSAFLICLILFANLNLFVYQNWCHGENVGYTINSKKFTDSLKYSYKEEVKPSFKSDLCCKDILINFNENSIFSQERIFEFSFFNSVGILPVIDWNISILFLNRKEGRPYLYSNPPPIVTKLFKLYCRYTFYS